jgi:hypothetical protein
VSDQVSHPYKRTGKLIVLYILMFVCLDSKLKDRTFCTKRYRVLSSVLCRKLKTSLKECSSDSALTALLSIVKIL